MWYPRWLLEPCDYGDDEEVSFTKQIQELLSKVEAAEGRLKETINSTLNCEEGPRDAIETTAREAKEYTEERLQRFDQALVACLECSDSVLQW